MTTGYVQEKVWLGMLDTLTRENALCMRLLLETGMRITDALSLTKQQVYEAWMDNPYNTRLRYKERKTGKVREVYLSYETCKELYARPGPESPWCFPGRDPAKHRTRQAVWKDLKRCSKLYRVNHKRLLANIGPHSARKGYAVKLYQEAEKSGSEDPLGVVMRDLNHADRSVTFLYALADKVSRRNP